MSDYRLEVRVKNGKLWSAMQQRGYATPAALSRASGISQTDISRMMNLQTSPFNKRFAIRRPVQRLCDFLGLEVKDLFPEEVFYEALENNKSTRMISSEEIGAISFQGESFRPDHLLEAEEEDGSIRELLDSLPDRERVVLRMHLGFDGEPKSLAEVGRCLGVTSERIRQIESRAYRMLRRKGARNLLRPGAVI